VKEAVAVDILEMGGTHIDDDNLNTKKTRNITTFHGFVFPCSNSP